MSEYRAPLRDIRFALHEVLDIGSHYSKLIGGEDVSNDIVDAILDEFGKFSENVIAPLNRSGDEEGCKIENGQVQTPKGFKDAFQQYVEAGWQAMSRSPETGGQGLAPSMNSVLGEMAGSANMAWYIYSIAGYGAMNTLEIHGAGKKQDIALRKLVSGEWLGTMCLTEAHCGSDLGLLRTKATQREDGCFSISGTKIFISAGDHDLTENIAHIVLARLPGAPAGTKGISLFLVPKYSFDDEGEITSHNNVNVGSIEKKMGIHGSSTCVLNFDGAKGFLIGEPNRGLQAMFTFMNTARVATAVQGLSHAELGFQKSLAYAKERLQMRSLSGPKKPNAEADPIIVHPDVRRMVLTQKSFTEGLRLFLYFLAKQIDLTERSPDAETKKAAEVKLELLTPIAKAFSSEVSIESASLAMQCFGGHGYIREWGVEQNLRDARIAAIYEGTTGIQALDLLGRKIIGSNGAMLECFLEMIEEFCVSHGQDQKLVRYTRKLSQLAQEWRSISKEIISKAKEDPDEIGAASVNYLMYSGYICLAFFWAVSAQKALASQSSDSPDLAFYRSKVITADFYFDHVLPRTRGLIESINAGGDSLMALDSESFGFY